MTEQIFVCLPLPGVEQPWTLEAYKSQQGYTALEKIL